MYSRLGEVARRHSGVAVHAPNGRPPFKTAEILIVTMDHVKSSEIHLSSVPRLEAYIDIERNVPSFTGYVNGAKEKESSPSALQIRLVTELLYL